MYSGNFCHLNGSISISGYLYVKCRKMCHNIVHPHKLQYNKCGVHCKQPLTYMLGSHTIKVYVNFHDVQLHGSVPQRTLFGVNSGVSLSEKHTARLRPPHSARANLTRQMQTLGLLTIETHSTSPEGPGALAQLQTRRRNLCQNV